MGKTEDARRWFSRPRLVRSRSAGSPCLVMHTWCPPVRVGYGSRAVSDRLANRTSCEDFFRVRHFLRETPRDLFCTIEASPTWNGVEIFAGLHRVLMSQLHRSLFSAALGVVVSEARSFFWHEICQGLQLYSEGRSLLLPVGVCF